MRVFEKTLARLYRDEAFLRTFLANPRTTLVEAGLTEPEVTELISIDRVGLVMANRSFRHKREKHLCRPGTDRSVLTKTFLLPPIAALKARFQVLLARLRVGGC